MKKTFEIIDLRRGGKNSERIFCLLAAIAAIFKISFFGFSYVPYLDDYVQYEYYSYFKNPMKNILFGGAKTAFSRPLAAIFDIYLTSPLFIFPPAALIFYTLIYAASGIIFYYVIKKYTSRVCPFFLIIYLLLPTCTEGTYWISAASRISFSLFFSGLAALYMQKKNFLCFCPSFLFSLCFYEQTALFSAALVFLIFISSPREYLRYFSAALVFGALLCAYYIFFGTKGDNAERMNIIFPPPTHMKATFFSVWQLLTRAQAPLYTKGFSRGLAIIIKECGIFRLIILFLLAVALSFFLPQGERKKLSAKELLLSTLLFSAPLVPFFFMKNPWLNFRNLVPSVFGFALLSELALGFIPLKKEFICLFLTLFLTVCCVTEIYDYNKTSERDKEIIYSVAKSAPKNGAFIYESSASDYLYQTSPYNDHIMSITGSDWGLTGAVRSVLKNRDIEVIKK